MEDKKIDILTLKKMLTFAPIQYKDSNNWNNISTIVELLKNNNAIILEKKHEEDIYDWESPIDYTIIDTWSTFDNNCISINYIYDDKLIANISIYDGDNFHGYRKGLRFELILELPDSYLTEISSSIEYYFYIKMGNDYDKYLEDVKNKWIMKKMKVILGKEIFK